MTEQWVQVAGFTLEISTHGRVRNTVTKHIRAPQAWKGYYRLRFGGKTHKIHHLVARAFIPNPLGLTEINHKDGCKSNNLVANLEWSTHQGNMQHAFETGLCKPLLGEDNGAAKLTADQVRQIRAKYIPGKVRQVDLGAEFGVSQRMISLIVRNEKWQHV